MGQAIFTSKDGGSALPASVIDILDRARKCAEAGAKVDLQVMCFSFTDRRIAKALVDLCRDHATLSLRIVADWSQSARGAPTVLEAMGTEGLRNIFIKFKLDVPYVQGDAGNLRYSYGASLGMLHHKTLLVAVDGKPQIMCLGSYNWTSRGMQAYENVVMTDDVAILEPFAAEFAALWSNHELTAVTERARSIMGHLKEHAASGTSLENGKLLAKIVGVEEQVSEQESARQWADANTMVAFSGSNPATDVTTAGHALVNDRRRLALLRPSGERKGAPLTLNTLALEAIRSVPAGASLKVAMYALSPRVPEFAAFLEAARRGVRVSFLLDGTIGFRMADHLRVLSDREHLDLSVVTTGRRMHQKYLCCPETGMVLSGTANMTEDATKRHSDHRILWRCAPDLCQAFSDDFDVICGRVGSQSAVAA